MYREKAMEVMLRKAMEKFESAIDDLQKGRYDSCISNLYYSAFQTVTAYMIAQGQATSKHTHARAYVNRELANAGLISKAFSQRRNVVMDTPRTFDASPIVANLSI